MTKKKPTSTNTDMSGYVTKRLAAERIGCSVRSVERMAERGVLNAYVPAGAAEEIAPLLLLGCEVQDVAAVAKRLDRLPTVADMAAVRPGLGRRG